jgi:uncharacterized protein
MIERTIKKQIIESIKNKPVTLVTGARQVGKSTLCYEMKKEFGFNYVSLDQPKERRQAVQDPEMFLQTHEWPLIIDEIQYAPGLFDVIEAIVNKEKLEKGSNNGMFLITGSETYELMRGVSESMAGRVSLVRMSPLSTREIFGSDEAEFTFDPILLDKRSKDFLLPANDLFRLITKGMYPEPHANPAINDEIFYSDYVTTYLERDVSRLINVKDKMKFQNFLEVLSSLTGEELVYDTIANAIGVKIDTVKSWISVLLAGDIVYLLQPYNELSIVKRIVKRPKIYFNDTGLACYLAGLNDPKVLQNSIFKGRFVETYIINEIRKSYLNNGIKPNFYYYRDNNQNEIDLVIVKEGVLHFIECKSGVEFGPKDVKGFGQLAKSNYEIGLSYLICNASSMYRIKEGVYAIPITSI